MPCNSKIIERDQLFQADNFICEILPNFMNFVLIIPKETALFCCPTADNNFSDLFLQRFFTPYSKTTFRYALNYTCCGKCDVFR